MKLEWIVALKVTMEPFRIDPAYDVFFSHKIDLSARGAGRIAPNAIGLFSISKVSSAKWGMGRAQGLNRAAQPFLLERTSPRAAERHTYAG
jgi:hypothetical protein